ncbi:MAG: AAA family ATPase [bacterium]
MNLIHNYALIKSMKKEIITIAGANGGGKSSTAKKVAEQLNFKHFSSGDFMRQIAKENNITLEELGKIAEKEDWVDKKIDDYVKQVGSEKKAIIDSRLAFHFIPESFKIYNLISATIYTRILMRCLMFRAQTLRLRLMQTNRKLCLLTLLSR